jgi:hypothetical protein
MTEPTTAAGKRLLGDVKACLGAEGYLGYHVTPDAILAIEAEAVAAALARVRERVEGLPLWCPGDWEWVVGRKAVLAIIDEEAASHPASHQPTAPELSISRTD